MKTNLSFYSRLLVLFVTTLILTTCGSSREILSSLTDSKASVDGQIDEWENNLVYLEDSKCTIGFQNDDNYLYLCLLTADKADIMKIFTLGVTVWFEPENGKILGLRYPHRSDPSEMMMLRGSANANAPSEFKEEDISKMEQSLMANQPELSIINEDEFPLYAYPINDKYGFQVCLGSSMERLVYELRIPLRNNQLSPVKLESLPGEKLEVKFETGDFNRPSMGQGMRPGGMGPGSGGMPPSSGGRSGGGMGSIRPGSPGGENFSKKFEIEFDVLLSMPKSN